MPTYDYECQKCGYTFEYFKCISEPDPKKCPQCKGKLKRLLGTGAGIIFKGSGFYATDYRKSQFKKEAERESAAGKTESKKSDSCKSCCKSTDGACDKS